LSKVVTGDEKHDFCFQKLNLLERDEDLRILKTSKEM
jgi:hypothetical protein